MMLKNGKIFLDGNVNDAFIPENIKNIFEVDVEFTTDTNNSQTVFIEPELLRN